LERLAPEPGEFERPKAQVTVMGDSQRWAEFARDAEDSLSASAHAQQLIEEAASERKPQRGVASENKRSKRA